MRRRVDEMKTSVDVTKTIKRERETSCAVLVVVVVVVD